MTSCKVSFWLAPTARMSWVVDNSKSELCREAFKYIVKGTV